jgi:hypothetical protein
MKSYPELHYSVAPDTTYPAPGCEVHDANDASRDMSNDEKVELVLGLYPESPPPTSTDVQNAVGKLVWDFLRQVKSDPSQLSVHQTKRLLETNWFAGFLTGGASINTTPRCNIAFEDLIGALHATCPDREPTEARPRLVNKCMGGRMMFEAMYALKYLKEVWNDDEGPSDANKREFRKLQWAERWLSVNMLEGTRTNLHDQRSAGKVVGKEVRLLLLRLFYPIHPPTWKDHHIVRIDNDRLWEFKPIQYLDDIANMWLGGGQRTTALTQTEMELLETLPWFRHWLDRLRNKRKRREVEKATLSASQYAEHSKRQAVTQGAPSEAYDEQEKTLLQSESEG